MTFSEFVNKALGDSSFKDEFHFGEISEAIVHRAHQISGGKVNLKGLARAVKADEIRHIKRRHKEHLFLLNELDHIFSNFTSIELSITKDEQTGQNLINFVLKITLESGVAHCVELRDHKRKILFLKTLFMEIKENDSGRVG